MVRFYQYRIGNFFLDAALQDRGVGKKSLVPDELNRRFVSEFETGGLPEVPAGTPLSQALPAGSSVRDLLELPAVRGIVESLVGPGALLDHHFVHVRKGAGDGRPEPSQRLHQDSTIDPRTHFDIQLLYFPEAIDETMPRQPALSLAYVETTFPTKQPGGLETFLDGMRKAGLRE